VEDFSNEVIRMSYLYSKIARDRCLTLAHGGRTVGNAPVSLRRMRLFGCASRRPEQVGRHTLIFKRDSVVEGFPTEYLAMLKSL
jgi:hypothetical protein